MMLRMWSFLCLAMPAALATSGAAAPKFVWPLGNTTVNKEVMSGRDAHLPASHQCFVFSQGVPGVPYRALTLTGETGSFVDFYLNGKTVFTDFALSLYIYPEGQPEGTILNYLCETGNVIKLAVLQGLLFISFWDEYGVSVGATAVPELLEPDVWNHLVISRQFDTGRIKTYHNGELVDDIDDDFPNGIELPIRGSIRLGSSQKDEADIKFKGRFACFQFHTRLPSDQEVKTLKDYCLPEQWRIVPEINLEVKEINGVSKECVTDYVEPSEFGNTRPKECDVIDRACISSGLNWNWVLRKNQWSGSKRETANFHLVSKDYLPDVTSKSLIGDVTVSSRKICPRLCLKVHGCQAYATNDVDDATARCVMFRSVVEASVPDTGARYFSLV